MFTQLLDPLDNAALTAFVALIPLAVLLIMLAGFRVSAWIATIAGSIVTIVLALWIWQAPAGDTGRAYLYGALTGVWAVDWITFWGLILFNTLNVTGLFDKFKSWLVHLATGDVRVQVILLAWAFGALLEGLVGFGYPWAVVAPVLIGLGMLDLDAIRVAAIANNAPVSYGALGAPIIALAAVTGYPLLDLSASVGRVVAVLALLPPWILIFLVSGRRGLRDGWPLAVVGSLGYIAGQFPVSQYLGPYLPDVAGAIVSFAALLVLLRVWRPRTVLGVGGVPVVAGASRDAPQGHGLSGRELFSAWLPFIVLIIVVVLWTGPWSPLPGVSWFKAQVGAISSITHKEADQVFNFAPFIGGTSILASWLIVAGILRPSRAQLGEVFRKTLHQMWGALLVGFFIFGLAYVYNFSGMAASLANAFSKIGPAFLVIAPVVGWIGVALSGSNTSTNAMFGAVQNIAGKLLGFPALLLPTLNSVGAEIGKPIAPQTASVGVSTSRFVRNEGEVIRHNMGWTLVLLGYLMVIGLLFYQFAPGTMLA